MKYQCIDVEYLKALKELNEIKYLKKLMIKGMQLFYWLFWIIIITNSIFSNSFTVM